MTIPELNAHIAKLKFRGASGVQMYEVDKQIRFASPFTTFVLVFMGVVVSSKKRLRRCLLWLLSLLRYCFLQGAIGV
jgi:hypothetical protein